MFDKHFFTDINTLLKSRQPVSYLWAKDGVYEIRITEIGLFCVKLNELTIEGLSLANVSEGFRLTLPRKIPFSILSQVIALFKEYCNIDNGIENAVQIIWNVPRQEYFVYVPNQNVTHVSVDGVIDTSLFGKTLSGQDDDIVMENIIVMDIHSHNTMPAVFSTTDDEDEVATRLYAVIGRVNEFLPDIKVRISCGGKFLNIKPEVIFENPFENFPQEWHDNIRVVSEAVI